MKDAAEELLKNGPRWGDLGREVPKRPAKPGGLKWGYKQWMKYVGPMPIELPTPEVLEGPMFLHDQYGKAKTLLEGWVEAKERGIQWGGAHRDLGILTLAAIVARSAATIERSLAAAVPKPDLSLMTSVYSSRLVNSAFPKDAKTIIERGKAIGIAAANGFLQRLGMKSIVVQAFEPSKWAGTGLESPGQDDSGRVKSDCAVVYLLALKQKFKKDTDTYLYMLQRLAARGITLGRG